MGKLDFGKLSPLFLHTMTTTGGGGDNKVMTMMVKSGNGDESDRVHVQKKNNDHDPCFHDWMDNEPSPIVNYVTPLFRFTRAVLMTHSRFEFDPENRLFCHRPGSWFRKLICLLVEIVIIVQLWGEGQLQVGLLKEKKLTGLFKIMSMGYVSIAIAFSYGLMLKGDRITAILNFLQQMTLSVARVGYKIPSKKTIRSISIALVVIYIVHALLYTIIHVDGHSGLSLGRGPAQFFTSCADQGARKIWILATNAYNISVGELAAYKFSEEWPGGPQSSVIFLAGIFHFVVHLMGSICWTMAFLTITIWGLLFWKVFRGFFLVISRNHVRNTLEDIRQFNTITAIIDQFNKAFGWTVLTGVVTGVLHFSVNVVDLFQFSQPWTQRTIVAIGLITFGVLLLAAAQVNHAASKITEVIKGRFQDESVWRDFHGDCTETTQGMILLFHEIQCNRIGFSGLGFFTITYSFIGTVLSLISTYSIVVMQFQT